MVEMYPRTLMDSSLYRNLGIRPYDKGLCELGRGCWAWLQPDGGWGLSNAGLVCNAGEALLADTLYDRPLTEEMLRVFRREIPAANNIHTVVNTHANGDHCNGNSCVPEAMVVASQAAVEEMPHESPQMMAQLLEQSEQMGVLGEFLQHSFGDYDFASVHKRLPDRAFKGKVRLRIGDGQVDLVEVGPAHTRGDILLWVPDAAVVFTGDILFIEDHPIVWAGPVSNWIAALDRIEQMQPELVVPGHGPITDMRGVRAMRDYLNYVWSEAKQRHTAGMDREEAARDIAFADYDSWGCAERIAINVASVYRELDGLESLPVTEGIELIARLWKDRRS